MTVKSLRDQHAEATRNALLEAARRLWATHGYKGAGVDRVAAEARVTRGAVYHHFPKGKKALFRAVYEQLAAEYLAHVEEAVDGIGTPLGRALAAANAVLEVTAKPEVHRLMLEDAPNVLGWVEVREIDRRYTRRAMMEALADLAGPASGLDELDVGLLADMVYGALGEASLALVETEDPAAVMASLDKLVRAAVARFAD